MNGAIISSTVRASSALIDQLVQKRVGSPVLTRTKQFDKLNRLSGISSVSSVPSVVNSASYGFNSANQRTRLTESDGKFWDFDYDPLGQVTSGVKKLADTTPVLGHSFGYSFDTIGNLNATAVNGQSATYAPDTAGLNQYAGRTVPAALDIIGTAEAGAKVAVNLAPAQRQGDLFYKQLPVANASVAKWQPIDVLAGKAGAGVGGADADIRQSGHLLLVKTPESFTYDFDGNLTGDGQWTYIWDAENRLTTMETQASAVTAGVPKQKLEFTYDFTGRRIAKRAYSWIPATSLWSPVSDIRFLYDGWNLLAEFNALSSNAVIRSYVWGIDLSGSAQGAGGVGGLLAIHQPSSIAHLPCYDGNGNVIAAIDASTGAGAAQFEYGPFGESLRVTGTAAANLPFRFSTKYQDAETGLYYYGYRYYCPSIRRWIAKDPIGEVSDPNLYGFARGNPIKYYDLFGLSFNEGIPRFALESYLEKKLGRPLDARDRQLLDSGCIGVTALMIRNQKTGNTYSRPEIGGDVKCFSTEPEAEQSKCPDCARKIVFAKTGFLEDSGNLKPVETPEPGQVPNNTISHGGGNFNYITRIDNDYVGMNGGKIEISDPNNPGARIEDPQQLQRGIIQQERPNVPEGGHIIWCRRCVKDK